ACLAGTHNSPCGPQAASIEVERLDLRDGIIGLARGLELVKSKAGEIKASFVNHDGRNRASPPERADIVLRSEANIFKGPISPVDAGQVHNVCASIELVCTMYVVGESIVQITYDSFACGDL